GPVRGLPRRLSRRSPGGPHRRPPPPRPDPYPRTPPVGSARCSVGREPPDPHLPTGPGVVASPLPDLRCPPLCRHRCGRLPGGGRVAGGGRRAGGVEVVRPGAAPCAGVARPVPRLR